MIVALWAALAMLAQDMLAVPLVQAEARNRAVLAGLLDTVGWLVTLTTTFISVDTLQGHSTPTKAVVIGAVSCANFVGTYTGTRLGKRWIKDDIPPYAQP